MSVNLHSLATKAPWWSKIAAKIVLSRLPITNQLWKRVGLFEYGRMEDPTYAFQTFKLHFEGAGMAKHGQPFVGLELGPGDSLFSALIASAYGAVRYYLVDVGPFALADMNPYRAMARFLAAQGLKGPDPDELRSQESMLAVCGASYGTSGLASLRAIPDESVDFSWSHAVLQDVRRAEFADTLLQLRRILRESGTSSHWIDLGDSVGGLNSLRFREEVWESPFMSGSGFYTNRIRYSEMLALFEKAGFRADVKTAMRWNRLPTPKSKLSEPFRNLPEEELSVRCFHVILTPRRSA